MYKVKFWDITDEQKASDPNWRSKEPYEKDFKEGYDINKYYIDNIGKALRGNDEEGYWYKNHEYNGKEIVVEDRWVIVEIKRPQQYWRFKDGTKIVSDYETLSFMTFNKDGVCIKHKTCDEETFLAAAYHLDYEESIVKTGWHDNTPEGQSHP